MPSLGITALMIVLATTGWWFWRAWRVNIPASRVAFQLCWGLGFILAVFAVARAEGSAAWWAFALGAMFLYLSATGAQRSGDGEIAVGDTLPDFTGVDDQGNAFDSASLAGTRVLLKFFRGHW